MKKKRKKLDFGQLVTPMVDPSIVDQCSNGHIIVYFSLTCDTTMFPKAIEREITTGCFAATDMKKIDISQYLSFIKYNMMVQMKSN